MVKVVFLLRLFFVVDVFADDLNVVFLSLRPHKALYPSGSQPGTLDCLEIESGVPPPVINLIDI